MAQDDYDDDDEGARLFTRQLEMIADGDLVHDASEEFHKLLRQLRSEAQHRNGEVKGKLVLTLNLSVEARGYVEVRPSITTKAADRKLSKGTLYLTKGGNLSAENPRQQLLGLREVHMNKRAPRDVGTDDGRMAAQEID